MQNMHHSGTKFTTDTILNFSITQCVQRIDHQEYKPAAWLGIGGESSAEV